MTSTNCLFGAMCFVGIENPGSAVKDSSARGDLSSRRAYGDLDLRVVADPFVFAGWFAGFLQMSGGSSHEGGHVVSAVTDRRSCRGGLPLVSLHHPKGVGEVHSFESTG